MARNGQKQEKKWPRETNPNKSTKNGPCPFKQGHCAFKDCGKEIVNGTTCLQVLSTYAGKTKLVAIFCGEECYWGHRTQYYARIDKIPTAET
jgi:hypothetical protein